MHHSQKKAQEVWQALSEKFGFASEREMLTKLYFEDGLSAIVIGRKIEKHSSTIYQRIRKLGLEPRTRHGTEYQDSPKKIYNYRAISDRINPYASPCVTCYRKEEDKNICAGTCQTLADFNEACDPCYINAEISTFHNIGVNT